MNHVINSLAALRSNHPSLLALLIAIGGIMAAVPASKSADFTLNWFSFGGGGGASTGGIFALAGSVGQPDAGTANGGPYSLVTGFWSGAGLTRSSDGPRLSITRAAGSIIISWPAPSTGFVLQETAVLHPGSWNNVATAPIDLGGLRQVTLNPPLSTQFYRLRK